jgi:hypothetical protein
MTKERENGHRTLGHHCMSNVHIGGDPEGKERKKRRERLCKEIMAETSQV